ncbi:hypothetical protein CHS0354_032839 [Potamilus streckersoni]|uniref:Uncharacterized protein n=1 Tax=Potamilus streckersoni TaxID=2493646 RepID=A0AAE0S913_9BIVA|nr:hypothetical protein CHS0354_032839 [Potamilus streckersoni]
MLRLFTKVPCRHCQDIPHASRPFTRVFADSVKISNTKLVKNPLQTLTRYPTCLDYLQKSLADTVKISYMLTLFTRVPCRHCQDIPHNKSTANSDLRSHNVLADLGLCSIRRIM